MQLDYQTNLRIGRFSVDRTPHGVTIVRGTSWLDWMLLPSAGMLGGVVFFLTMWLSTSSRGTLRSALIYAGCIILPAVIALLQRVATRVTVVANRSSIVISVRRFWKIYRESFERDWFSHVCVEKFLDPQQGLRGRAVVAYMNNGRVICVVRGRKRDLGAIAEVIRQALDLPAQPSAAELYPNPTPRRFERIVTAHGAIISYAYPRPWLVTIAIATIFGVGWYFFDTLYLSGRLFDRWSTGPTFSLLRGVLVGLIAAVVAYATIVAFRGRWTISVLPDAFEVHRDGFRAMHEEWQFDEIAKIDPPSNGNGPTVNFHFGAPLELIGSLPHAQSTWLFESLHAAFEHVRGDHMD